MIVPSVADILRSIEHTLDTVIRPTLQGTIEQSAAATISHLLRHSVVRITLEGQILTDDIAALRPLLTVLSAYCESLREPKGREIAAKIEESMARAQDLPQPYVTLEQAAQRANELRTLLMAGLDYLSSIRPREGSSVGYQSLRSAIRGYLAEQLRREADLIHPAFEGRGARR
jgi:hypothetical protein